MKMWKPRSRSKLRLMKVMTGLDPSRTRPSVRVKLAPGLRAASENKPGDVPPWFDDAVQNALEKYDAMKAQAHYNGPMSPLPSQITVTADPHHPQRGTLRCGDLVFTCVLGRTGISSDKHEGDGATPVGRFSLRRVLYRADREPAPDTSLPVEIIKLNDGWCDAPDDVRYNQPVTLPYPASAESMWREDNLYDMVVVLGHNDDPVISGRGSAIFMHVAPPEGKPTVGCVALTAADLRRVLKTLQPGAVIEIR